MAAVNPHGDKVQPLPLLCVETILKFTPTSKLIRVCSDAVPLPGAFWSFGLEAVLKKRLPLSLRDDLPCLRSGRTCNAKTIFDISGARIATVKKPEMFRLCPLRELIGSATLAVRVLPVFWLDAQVQSYVVHGEALLSHMPNVIELTLVVHDSYGYYERKRKDLFKQSLKHLLPKLQFLEVSISHRCDSPLPRDLRKAFVSFIGVARIDEMSCLRRLILPEAAFDCLVRASSNPLARLQAAFDCLNLSASARRQAVLAGMNSLGIGHNACYGRPLTGSTALNFVSLRFMLLSQLQVVVLGEFRAYLAAFRALPGLTSLGLHVLQAHLTGCGFPKSSSSTIANVLSLRLIFDGSGTISSVSDLRIICRERTIVGPDRTDIFKIATFFPNAKAVALKGGCNPDPLELATTLFGERQLFPTVAKLGCFFFAGEIFSCSSEVIRQFLANPHLPEAVDLSQITLANLARNANLLTAIYCIMQTSSVKSLLLRGPVHREELPRLQSQIDLNGENAKVFAWKDQDLGDQPGNLDLTDISEQTDNVIIGKKTSGCLKGEQFTIRVFHQLAKRVEIFD